MNYIYVLMYIIICIILFFVIFMNHELFIILFKKKYNNIIDYNDKNYTGGFTYNFNPFGYFS